MIIALLLILVGIIILIVRSNKKNNNEYDLKNIESKHIATKEFIKFNLNELGNEKIHDAIRGYDDLIVYYCIALLENGNKYALLIGTSDEWINVISLNRATPPLYNVYGFSINQKRWSYGSKVLGAKEIRLKINDDILEIILLMKSLESLRRNKEKERLCIEFEDKKNEKEYEKQRIFEEKK